MKNASIKELLSSKDQAMILEGITYLRNKQLELMLRRNDPAIVYKSIFAEFEEKPSNFDQLEWDKVRFIVYLAFAQLIGSDFPLNSSPLSTKYGPLFSCFCYCCTFTRETKNYGDDLTKFFFDYLQRLLNSQQQLPFYSHNSATDVKNVLSFLKNPLIPRCIESFLQVDISKLTYSDFTIFQYTIEHCIPTSAVIRKFFTSEISPSFIIDRFFKHWRKSSDNQRDPKDPQLPMSPENIQTREKITKLFENATYQKYTEISQQFKWREVFYFFETIDGEKNPTHQGRVMCFIDYGLRMIKKMRVEMDIPDISKLFNNLYRKFQTNSYYPYFLQGIISAIRHQTMKLMNVQLPMLVSSPDTPVSKKLYFKDQKLSDFKTGQDSSLALISEIDKCIFTLVNPAIVTAQEAGDKIITQCTTKFEQIGFALEAPVSLGVVNTLDIITKNGNQPDPETSTNSTIFFGVREFVEYSMKLLVALTYKITEQKRYADRQPNNSSLANLTFFPSLFNSITTFLKDLPATFENVTAEIISKVLYEAVENHQATAELIQTFADAAPGNPHLFRTITRQMVYLGLQNFSKLLSPNFEVSSTVTDWMFFVIRLCIKIDNSTQSLCSLIHFYKSPLIIKTFSSITLISNPLAVLKLLKVMLKIANKDTMKIEHNYETGFLVKVIDAIKGHLSYIQNRLLDIFFTLDRIQNFLPFHAQLLEMCLLSNERKLIRLVSPVLSRIVKNPKLKSDLESDSLKSLISKWYSAMPYCNPDDYAEMMKCMQDHPSSVLSPVPKKNFEEIGLIFEPGGTDIAKFITSIFHHLKEEDEEAAHLLALLVLIFDFIKVEFYNNAKKVNEAVKQILFVVNYIAKFSRLSGKALTFMDQMNEFFVGPFCSGYSTNYLLNLFIACGSQESKASDFMELAIHRFLAKCQAIGYEVSIMGQVVDQIYELVFTDKWFMIHCIAFTFITKYCPAALPPKRLELQLYVRSVDDTDLDAFSSFLKVYEASLDAQGKQDYVMAIYNCKTWRPNNILLKFIQRLKKLKTPVILDSPQLSTTVPGHDYFTLAIRFTLIVACSSSLGNLPIETIQEIQKFMTIIMSQNDQRDKQILTFILTDAILENQIYTEMIFQESKIVCSLIHRFRQLQQAFSPKSLGRTTYNLYLRYPNDPTVQGYLKQQANNEQQFFYYVRTIPQVCNPQHVKNLVTKIKLFAEDDQNTQKPSFDEIIKCFKVLSSEEWLNVPGAQDLLMAETNDYKSSDLRTGIEAYVSSVLLLMNSQSIPFWSVFAKLVLNFSVKFSQNVSNILFLPKFITNPRASQLMEYLIINDNTNSFFQDFLNIATPSPDFSHIPFLFIRIYQSLVKIDRFKGDIVFVKKVDQIFHKLLDLYPDTRLTNEFSFVILSVFAEAQLELIKTVPEIDKIFAFAELFKFPEFKHADMSSLFKQAIFFKKDPESQELYQNIIFQCVSMMERYSPHIIDILLSSSIKSTNSFNVEMTWTILLQSLEFDNENMYFVSIHNIRLMLQNDVPVITKFPMFARFIPVIMSKSNPDNIIECIRALTIYSKKTTIPQRLLYDVLKHLFINSAFLENPYKRFSFEFIKTNEKELENLPLDVIEALHIFISDSCSFTSKSENPSTLIFREFPVLSKYMPFSPAASLAHSYWAAKEKNIARIDHLFWQGILFCTTVDLSDEERDIFTPVVIDYLSYHIKDKDKTKIKLLNKAIITIMISSLQYMMKKPINCEFPESIVREMIPQIVDQSLTESVQVVILCCMLRYCPLKISQENFKIVKDIYENLRNNRIMTTDNFFKTMTQCILSLPQNEMNYFKLITDAIEYFFSYAPCRTYFIKARILIEEVAKSNQNQYLFLADARDSLIKLAKRYNSQYISDIVALLIEKITFLKPETQRDYILSLFRSVPNQLIMSSHRIIASSKVDPSVRYELIKTISKFLVGTHLNAYERILSAMVQFTKETSIDTTSIAIRLLVFQAIRGNCATRLHSANTIISILGDDEKVRFNSLVDMLPGKMWDNTTLPFISLLLLPQDKHWNTLVALSAEMDDISAQIATKAFAHILCEFTNKQMRKLLCRALDKNNAGKQFTSIIQAIVTSYHNTPEVLPFELVRMAAKFVPLQCVLSEYIDLETDHRTLILPHEQNSNLFASLYGNVSIEETAASAAYFLRNYNTANAIFSMIKEPENKSLLKMKEIAAFFTAESDLVTHMIRPTDSTPDIMLDEIEKLSGVIKTQPGESLQGDISVIRKMNIQYFKSRPQPTYWQILRSLSIQYLVSIASDFATNGKLTEHLSYSAFNMFNNLPHLNFLINLGFAPSSPQYQRSFVEAQGDCLVLPLISQFIFKEIAGMLKYNDIAVPIERIENSIMNFQAMLMKKEVSVHGLIAWQVSTYHIFMNTPSMLFLRTAADAALATIQTTNPNSPTAYSAAGQVISLLRYGYASNDQQLKDAAVISSRMIGDLPREKKDAFMFWSPQLMTLLENKPVKDALEDAIKNPEFYNSYYMFRKSKLSNDYLREPSIAFLNAFEEFIDSLFTIDWTVYSSQNWMKSLIMETSVLSEEAINNIDIESILKNVPMSSIEQAIHKTHHWFKTDNFAEFATRCKEAVKNKTVNQLINELVPSQKPYEETKQFIEDNLSQINSRSRFFRFSKHIGEKTYIRRFIHDIEKASQDTFILQALLFETRKIFIAVTKVEMVSTLNTAVNILQTFVQLAKEKPINIANIERLSSPISMSIGPNYRATFFMTPPQYMTNMFYESVGTKTIDWEATQENIEKLPTDRALKYLSMRFTKKNFYAMQNSLLNGAASSSAVRHFLGTNYPKLDEIVLLLKSGEIPLLSSSIVTVPRDPPTVSCFRLSPTIASLLGPKYKGKLALSMSHFMSTYNETLATLVPMLHILYMESFNVFDMNVLKEISDIAIARGRQLILPDLSVSTEKDAVDWMETMMGLIDAATIPDDKPPASIPWF